MKKKRSYRGAQVISLRLSPEVLDATESIAKRMRMPRSDVLRLALKQLITTWRNDKPAVETLALDLALEEIHDPRQVDLFD